MLPPVIAAIVLFLFFAILVGTGVALGGAVMFVLLAIAGIAVIVWFVGLLFSRRTVADVVREQPKADLLGPGGPDDPDRSPSMSA
jgi:hypothetical protein